MNQRKDAGRINYSDSEKFRAEEFRLLARACFMPLCLQILGFLMGTWKPNLLGILGGIFLAYIGFCTFYNSYVIMGKRDERNTEISTNKSG